VSTRPAKAKPHVGQHADATHVRKDFEEVAERIFRDDSPAEPLYGSILADEPSDNAA